MHADLTVSMADAGLPMLASKQMHDLQWAGRYLRGHLVRTEAVQDRRQARMCVVGHDGTMGDYGQKQEVPMDPAVGLRSR